MLITKIRGNHLYLFECTVGFSGVLYALLAIAAPPNRMFGFETRIDDSLLLK